MTRTRLLELAKRGLFEEYRVATDEARKKKLEDEYYELSSELTDIIERLKGDTK